LVGARPRGASPGGPASAFTSAASEDLGGTLRVDIGQRPGTADEPSRIHIMVRDHATLVFGADPSRALLECRWTDDTVEVLASGDATAIVFTGDGRAHRVHQAISEAGRRGSQLSDVDAVLLMSATVADVVDRYSAGGFPHWHDIFQLVAADGVQALVDHVHAVEATDAGRQRRPGPEPHGDKAAVFLMTATYGPHKRMQPPFSTLAAADRAREREDFTTAIDLYRSVVADLTSPARQPLLDEDLHSTRHCAHLG
jgi:hypothetical protein